MIKNDPTYWRESQLQNLKTDVMASLVVFLVALPLCLGIAIASGAPPIAGLLSGIIGGLVVASLGGCPMQVSGPANGLIVLVLLITQQYDMALLGAVVLAAGAIQLLAGLFRLGQVFRAIPPAIIHGLMTGFAVIIFASQFHVMLDDPVRGSPLDNILYIPQAIWDAVADRSGAHRAAGIGILTIAVLLSWKHIAPRWMYFLPASLVAVMLATAVTAVVGLPIARVALPDTLIDSIHVLEISALGRLWDAEIFQLALIMAFLASTETLLSASAVDRLHDGSRTNYDRELTAQGVGNMLCGVVGAIPLTGVIIRSAANVAAGARSRLSSVLHGFWILVFVVFLPGVLSQIPTASLAAVLVVAVFRLIDVRALREIWEQDRREIAIYAATAATIVFWGVLPGVLLGVGLAIAKLLYTVGHLDVSLETDSESGRTVLSLHGTATFLSLPKLASALESVPARGEVHVRVDDLSMIDHACLDLLINWGRQNGKSGRNLIIDWNSLQAKFANQQRPRSPVLIPVAAAAGADGATLPPPPFGYGGRTNGGSHGRTTKDRSRRRSMMDDGHA